MPPAKDSNHGVTHDIVVVGASAGGIEALTNFVAHLPQHLPAAIFVVVHISAEAPSVLPQILSRAGPLPASAARDGAPIEHSHIYIAPPDKHLLLTDGEMRVTHGPRENRHRPAIDPLFRSAALAFGQRVVGVVLSGALNDGTAGLLAIKRAGGIAMVQDPATAEFPSMPESALAYVRVDWCLAAAELARKVIALATSGQVERKGAVHMSDELDDAQKEEMLIETEIAGLNPMAASASPRYGKFGKLSSYTCPDCHGPLWEIQDGPLLRFRCRVGHAFTGESVVEGHAVNIEEALWMALNTLEESELLYTRLANQARERRHTWMADRFARKLHDIQHRADVLRQLLTPDAPDRDGGQKNPAPSTASSGGRDEEQAAGNMRA